MNDTTYEESFLSQEDSFRVMQAPHRKKNTRAIIASDSEDEDDSFRAHISSDDSYDKKFDDPQSFNNDDDFIENSDVDDSFDESGLLKESSMNRGKKSSSEDPELQNASSDSGKNLTLSRDEVDTTDDDSDGHVPTHSSDEEADVDKNSTGQDSVSSAAEESDPSKEQNQNIEENYDKKSYSDTASFTSPEYATANDDSIKLTEVSRKSSAGSSNVSSTNGKENKSSPYAEQSQQNFDDSAEIIENSLSIVDISSEEEASPPSVLKQTNIKSFLVNSPKPKPKSSPQPTEKTEVGQKEYQDQIMKIHQIEQELTRARNAMKVIKLTSLPDKGKSLIDKEKSLNSLLQEQKNKLGKMIVETKPVLTAQNKVEVAWDAIEAGVNAVAPSTFGKKGVARFNAEKELAVEALDHLHKSLDTCPTENDSIEDPKGLKIPLMPHQRRALAWLLWREQQKPSGGLLADDMGLGKTLTMISLILKSRELHPDEDSEKENYRDKYSGGTLVVCPASLMNQWSGEIENRTKRGLLGVELHHGPKRESKAKRLAQHDVVVTTYGLVLNESDRNGAIFGVRWRRIILDESHQIRNFKSQTAEAVFRLSGKSKWALTGTPVHNKELDMYAILKFLRCSPFDDLQTWKRWMADKSTGGEMRLHAVISSLMLRRTKAELMEKGTLESLPDRTWELISVKLEKEEMDVYQKILLFSRTLFAQFLHQRAEKNQDAYDLKFNQAPPDPNGEYFKMRNKLLKLNRVKEVSQHEILVLLLRLRQICCHPYLIKEMLRGDEDLGDADDYEESEELNLLEQLNKLNIQDEDDNPAGGLSDENVGLKEAAKGYLNPSSPIFRPDRASSKIRTLIKVLKEKVSTGDKVIIVSQWTSFLDLVAYHVKEEGIAFDCLTGKVQVSKRMAIVDNFNDPKSNTRVLLLSLTAGGVGLNLVGANHLFLLDLHWNPQLENQAQDRIYRMGQKKSIFVYKFMAEDTIEQRIKALQERKLDIANSLLTGSKRVIDNKLTLQDLKMLFGF